LLLLLLFDVCVVVVFKGLPWLPRDPMQVVIKIIATSDLIQEGLFGETAKYALLTFCLVCRSTSCGDQGEEKKNRFFSCSFLLISSFLTVFCVTGFARIDLSGSHFEGAGGSLQAGRQGRGLRRQIKKQRKERVFHFLTRLVVRQTRTTGADGERRPLARLKGRTQSLRIFCSLFFFRISAFLQVL